MTTDVAFVIETDDEYRDVLAVMPGVAGTNYFRRDCTSYAHMGQHSACHFDYIREKCVGANPNEYADLLAELKRIGYDDIEIISICDINADEYTEDRRKQVYNV